MKYLFSGHSGLYDLLKNELGHAENLLMPYWDDYKSCTYDGVQWSNLPPLDQILLYELRHCESIFLKMADRLLPGSTYQERKDHYLRHIRYWNWRISDNLDLAIFQNVPHEGFDFIIYSICKLRNIKTLCFYTLPIRPSKVYLVSYMTDIFNSGKEIHRTYEDFKVEKSSINISADCISKLLKPYIEEHSSLDNNITPFTRGTSRKNALVEWMRIGKVTLSYLKVFNFQLLLEAFLRRTLVKVAKQKYMYYQSEEKVKNYYQANCSFPDLTLPYIYFPLHFQPECSTSPLGGEFVHQYLVCEMLAYAASRYNICIYIKEHPRASKSAYVRNIPFYKKLLECDNVILVENSVNTFDLIDKSVAVATVSGSAGWEAVLRSKPVLLFGSRFYESAPGVFRINKNDDLTNALDLILNKKFSHSSQDILIYLKSLESHVFEAYISEGDSMIATVDGDTSNKNFATAIMKYIRSPDFNSVTYDTAPLKNTKLTMSDI